MSGGSQLLQPIHRTCCSRWLKTTGSVQAAASRRGGIDGWTDGRMDGWMDGWMVGWMDGWMDGPREEARKCRDFVCGSWQGWSEMEFVSFEETAAGRAPAPRSCPQIPGAQPHASLHAKLGWTVPGCLAGGPPLSLVPPSALTAASSTANTPAARSTAGTPHRQGIVAAGGQQLWQTYRLPAGFQINWSLLLLMQEMQCIQQQRQSSTGVPARTSPVLPAFLQAQVSAPAQPCPGKRGRSEVGSPAAAPCAQATSATAVGSQQT